MVWTAGNYKTILNPLCPHVTRQCGGLPSTKLLRNTGFV